MNQRNKQLYDSYFWRWYDLDDQRGELSVRNLLAGRINDPNYKLEPLNEEEKKRLKELEDECEALMEVMRGIDIS